MIRVIAFIAAASVLTIGASSSASAEGGCYRMGETGYHYYNFCLGPWFLYAQGSPRAEGAAPVGMSHRRHRHHYHPA